MLPKIFVLLVLAISPDGKVMTQQAGQFDTEQACTLKGKDLRVQAQVAKVPGDKLMLVCMETPWVVKGATGV